MRCIDDVLIAGNDSRSRPVIVISNHVVPTRADAFFVPSSSGSSATRGRLLWIATRVMRTVDVDGYPEQPERKSVMTRQRVLRPQS